MNRVYQCIIFILVMQFSVLLHAESLTESVKKTASEKAINPESTHAKKDASMDFDDESFFDEDMDSNASAEKDPNFGRSMPENKSPSKVSAPKQKKRKKTKRRTRRKKTGREGSKDPIQDYISRLTHGNKIYARETYNSHKALKDMADEDNEKPNYLAFTPFTLFISDIEPGSDPNIIFTHEERDLYVIRTPGLILNNDVIDGIQMAYKQDKIRLIVVLVRDQSRFYEAACMGKSPTHSPVLLAKLHKAVKLAKKELPDLTCREPRLIENIAKHNMFETMRTVLLHMPGFKKRIGDAVEPDKRTSLLGAMENVEKGTIVFYDTSSL